MYLTRAKTGGSLPFVYSMSYDASIHAIEFNIHPSCAELLQGMNPQNLPLKYCCEKLGFNDIETDLNKNFGINNQSINRGLVNGLINLAFPLVAPYTLSSKPCTGCGGSGERQTFGFGDDKKCFFCRGTGKEIDNRTNMHEQCASIYLLTKYLNWGVLMKDENPFPKNHFGRQELFLEVDPKNGIGGECSKNFFSELALVDTNEMQLVREKEMFELHSISEGRHLFPEITFYDREFQFRCEASEKGRIYVEVPGQNGCSIHMDHHQGEQFTCHNIDRPQQQFCLLAGFSMLWRDYYAHSKPV